MLKTPLTRWAVPVLILLALVPGHALAQSVGGAGLDVQPAGQAVSPLDIVVSIVQSLPSPFGGPMPGLVQGGAISDTAAAVISLDDSTTLYSFRCDSGRCTGTAADIWYQVPSDQKQAYLTAVMDQLTGAFPDRPEYTVRIGGRTFITINGYQAPMGFMQQLTQDRDGNRYYSEH